MPTASATRSRRTRRTTPTVPPTYRRDSTRASPLRHLSWLSCGQWPAQTWVFVDGTASAGLQVEATTSAIAAEAACVVGARLPNDTAAARSGAPDVLVCARGGYVAVDVKHHRTATPACARRPPFLWSPGSPGPWEETPSHESRSELDRADAHGSSMLGETTRELLTAHTWRRYSEPDKFIADVAYLIGISP